jgi:alkylhydroperoxidase family enzyme
LAAVALLTLGPVFGLMLLLNRRDRRHAALLGLVWERTPRDLASLIAVQVRCAVYSSRCMVTVEMQPCSRDEIWEAIARWSPHLPPRARLLVKGTVDRGRTADVTLEARRRPSSPSLPRRFLLCGAEDER